MRKFGVVALIFILLFTAISPVFSEGSLAADLKGQAQLLSDEFSVLSALEDRNQNTYLTFGENSEITLQSETPIAALYVEFDRIPDRWELKIEENDTSYICGTNGFLHEFVDVFQLCSSSVNTVSLSFKTQTAVAEIYAFSEGDLPDFVQRWEYKDTPCDLLLLPTHSDDDQLFFAGIVPTYVAKGLDVQVAFFAHHWATHDRPHELLNALWHAGLVRYPLISEFVDAYSESAKGAEDQLAYDGFSREDVLLYQTRLLRQYRPQVVVGHDLKGEYGHGQHMYNAETLCEALELAKDELYDAQSFEEFGTWDVLRCYLHLYEDNAVVCNFDEPLQYFGGKTAFEVSKEAFAFHHSQQWTWFSDWIDVDRADQINLYSPTKYGLYYAANADTKPNADFFDGLETYAVQEELKQLEEEIAQKLEEERKENEEELQKIETEMENLGESLDETKTKLDSNTRLLWILLVVSASLILVFGVIISMQKNKYRRNLGKKGR